MNYHRLCLGLLVATMLFFRVWQIDRTPGFNADEAWTPVQASAWLDGAPANWITPTGRLISPIHVASSLAASAVLPPSITTARLPAMVWGIALVLFAFWLLPKALGETVGTIAAIAISLNPTLVAYSRIGWEPSQSPLLVLLALYFNWRKKAAWTWFFFFASVVTHSTNVFLAPILFLPAMLETWERRRKYFISEQWPTLLGLALVGTFLVTQMGGGVNGWGGLAGVAAWAAMPFRYATDFIGLFSGVTVYRDFIGAPPLVLEMALTILVGGVLIFAARELRRLAADDEKIRRSLVAYLAALGAFFLLGGYKSLTPGYERYALFLIVPTLCLVARALEKTPAWLSTMLATYLVAGFLLGYFISPEPAGTQVHYAYRTSSMDPKRAAFESLRREALSMSEPLEIIAEDWWTYWPLRYFALHDPHLRVTLAAPDSSFRENARFVGFTNGPRGRALPSSWKAELYRSSSGEPIVGVWRKEIVNGSP